MTTARFSPLTPTVRTVRAGAAGAASVLTAAAVHRVGGGVLDPLTVLLLTATAAVVAWPLTARRISAPRLVGLMLLCQGVTHVSSMSTEHHEMASAAAPGSDAWMLAAHVLGTALATVLLLRGEGWAWRLGRSVLRGLRLRVVEPPATDVGRIGGRVGPILSSGVLLTAPVRGPPRGR